MNVLPLDIESMKKIILLILSSTVLYAAEPPSTLETETLHQEQDSKFNLHTQPLFWAFREPNIGVDYAFNPHWSIAPEVGFWLGEESDRGILIGAKVTTSFFKDIYKNGFRLSGLVAEMFDSKREPVHVFAAFGSYVWFWQSGFNLSLGAGFAGFSGPGVTSMGLTSGFNSQPVGESGGTLPVIDIGLGWRL